MSTLRHAHNEDNPYFMYERATAQNKSLSYEARGMLAYILSKHTDWRIMIEDLIIDGCGRDKTYRILNELKSANHIKRERVRKEDGTFFWGDYLVFEHPFPENPEVDTGEPFPENPDTVQPDTVKPTLHNIESTEDRKEEKITAPSERPTEGALVDNPPLGQKRHIPDSAVKGDKDPLEGVKWRYALDKRIAGMYSPQSPLAKKWVKFLEKEMRLYEDNEAYRSFMDSFLDTQRYKGKNGDKGLPFKREDLCQNIKAYAEPEWERQQSLYEQVTYEGELIEF